MTFANTMPSLILAHRKQITFIWYESVNVVRFCLLFYIYGIMSCQCGYEYLIKLFYSRKAIMLYGKWNMMKFMCDGWCSWSNGYMGKVTPFIMKLKHKSRIINMQTHKHIFWFLSLDVVRKFSSTFTVLYKNIVYWVCLCLQQKKTINKKYNSLMSWTHMNKGSLLICRD